MAAVFFLGFGGVFTLVSSLLIFLFYFSNIPTMNFNGVPMPIEEFRAMPEPKIFLGAFFVVGIICLIIGAVLLIKKVKTKNGYATFGIITDIYASSMHVNDQPILKAEVIVAEEDGLCGTYTGEIGVRANAYHIGDIIHVKHYKQDIHVVSVALPVDVPTHIKDVLMNEYDLAINGVWAQEHERRNNKLG